MARYSVERIALVIAAIMGGWASQAIAAPGHSQAAAETMRPFCSNANLDATVRSIVSAFVRRDYSCLPKIHETPERLLVNGRIAQGFLESLDVPGSGRSYNDIVHRNGVRHDVWMGRRTAQLLLIDASKYPLYLKNKDQFRRRYWKRYFMVCELVHPHGRWLMAEDSCITETDVGYRANPPE